MEILVTGGAGFIGSHLCEHLVEEGHQITVVDDLSSGDKSNLCSIIDVIDFYEGKIEVFDFSKLSNIDAVVHLAAQVSVPVSIDDFGRSSSSNLLGTIKVIDFCSSSQLPLVYASSSALYGNLELGDDSSSTVDLLSPYGADKYVMEIYAKVAYKLYKLSSIGLRFYNVYGPRQDPSNAYSGVISIFSDQLLREKSAYYFRNANIDKDIIKKYCMARKIKLIIVNSNNKFTNKYINIKAREIIKKLNNPL